MRTKTLLVAAALGAAGVASSIAQSVYSVNVVGYVNVSCISGYNFICNPLATTNNLLSQLIPAPEENTQVLTWNASIGTFDTMTYQFGAWDSDRTFSPGEGFILNPPNATTITFVGEVLQGTNLAINLASGYNMVGSKVPQAGLIQTDLNFQPQENDQVLMWNSAIGTYDTFTYQFGAWDTEPTLGVGRSCFVSPVVAGSWTRSFTVN